jgi:hypothetical protein
MNALLLIRAPRSTGKESGSRKSRTTFFAMIGHLRQDHSKSTTMTYAWFGELYAATARTGRGLRRPPARYVRRDSLLARVLGLRAVHAGRLGRRPAK